MPPQRRYPDRPPLMVKGVLVVVKIMRKDTFYNSTRNEICLTANEILLCKMKSDKSDDISLREVVILQNARKGDRRCVFDTLFQNTTPSFRKGVRGKHLL